MQVTNTTNYRHITEEVIEVKNRSDNCSKFLSQLQSLNINGEIKELSEKNKEINTLEQKVDELQKQKNLFMRSWSWVLCAAYVMYYADCKFHFTKGNFTRFSIGVFEPNPFDGLLLLPFFCYFGWKQIDNEISNVKEKITSLKNEFHEYTTLFNNYLVARLLTVPSYPDEIESLSSRACVRLPRLIALELLVFAPHCFLREFKSTTSLESRVRCQRLLAEALNSSSRTKAFDWKYYHQLIGELIFENSKMSEISKEICCHIPHTMPESIGKAFQEASEELSTRKILHSFREDIHDLTRFTCDF